MENVLPSILNSLTIEGFKSINKLEEFKLNNLNILIGANGAGKSNFKEFFVLLHSIMNDKLNDYVRNSGGVNDLLHGGPKQTEKMFFKMMFGDRGYKFKIAPFQSEKAILLEEKKYYLGGTSSWWELGNSINNISSLKTEAFSNTKDVTDSMNVYNSIINWQIYHFHDTSKSSKMRHYEIVQDNLKLREDAANIAPFLLKIRKENPNSYQDILDAVRLAIPFFDDFILDPTEFGESIKVNLSWKQKGSDYPMQPYHFSDGSIRFISLATALLQPEESAPVTIILDEPELGLHPTALNLLAEIVKAKSNSGQQLIICTQSADFINNFCIEDIVVVNRKGSESSFERLNEEDFIEWLEDYSIGELWTKNVINAGTSYV